MKRNKAEENCGSGSFDMNRSDQKRILQGSFRIFLVEIGAFYTSFARACSLLWERLSEMVAIVSSILRGENCEMRALRSGRARSSGRLSLPGRGVAFFLAAMISCWFVGAAFADRPSPIKGPAQLYFIAVGSADYSEARPPFFPNVKDRPEYSAGRVARELMLAGARYGILLTSRKKDPGTAMVTRDDVLDALYRLKARIRADRKAAGNEAFAPRVVFYFMGHGLGDEVGRYLYLLPGNIRFTSEVNQTTTIKMIKTTIWSTDLVSALVNFRIHTSMTYLDEFVPSQAMPDFTDPVDLAKTVARIQQLNTIDERQRQNGDYPPEGNPPIPYLILFDNCYGDVKTNLVKIAPDFTGTVDGLLADLETDGLVLYAARPGQSTPDVHDPDDNGPPFGENAIRMGPLAARLVLALRGHSGSGPIRFEQLKDRLLEQIDGGKYGITDIPEVPYTVSKPATDVLQVEFIPAGSGNAGAPYSIDGSGTTAVLCCE